MSIGYLKATVYLVSSAVFLWVFLYGNRIIKELNEELKKRNRLHGHCEKGYLLHIDGFESTIRLMEQALTHMNKISGIAAMASTCAAILSLFE